MCGRFIVNTGISETVESALHVFMDAEETHDVTPGMTAQILVLRDGKASAVHMKWGVTHPAGHGLLINARAETVLLKPFFKGSVIFNRCVIPASRFYEWDRDKNKAVFDLPGEEVMYLAGFYQESELENRFVILTTAANDSMRPVHDRMPLMIPEDEVESWLSDTAKTADFLGKSMPALHFERPYEQLSLF